MTRTRTVLLALLVLAGLLLAAHPAAATHNCLVSSHYGYHRFTGAYGLQGWHYGTHSYYWGQSCYTAHGNISHTH